MAPLILARLRRPLQLRSSSSAAASTRIARPAASRLEGGRVSGVITEAGVIKTKTAVLAGGAWASSFCRQLGIRFPQAYDPPIHP